MKNAWIAGFILFFLSAVPIKAWGQLRVEVHGAQDTLRVGDPMLLELKISAPSSGKILLPNWSEVLDKFDLLAAPDTSKFNSAGGHESQIGLKLTCYEAGEQVLQPIPIRWISADGSRSDSAATEPVIIHVSGVVPDSILAAADTTQKPYKLLQPNRVRRLGISLAEILPWILAVLAAAGAFFLIRRWLRWRRRKRTTAVEAAIPIRPAYEIALEELDRLRHQRIFQAGRIKDFYVILSEIERRYIEAQFIIPAMESTSFQLLRDLEAVISDHNLRSVLQTLLDDADLAKFAKQRPAEETCQRDLERGYIFVHKTMPQPISPLAQEAA